MMYPYEKVQSGISPFSVRKESGWTVRHQSAKASGLVREKSQIDQKPTYLPD